MHAVLRAAVWWQRTASGAEETAKAVGLAPQRQAALHRKLKRGAAVMRHYTPPALAEQDVKFVSGDSQHLPVVGTAATSINPLSGLAR